MVPLSQPEETEVYRSFKQDPISGALSIYWQDGQVEFTECHSAEDVEHEGNPAFYASGATIRCSHPLAWPASATGSTSRGARSCARPPSSSGIPPNVDLALPLSHRWGWAYTSSCG